MVYIKEAHTSDLWQMASNIEHRVVYADPRTLDQRFTIAGTCAAQLHLRIPALVDDMHDGTEAAYTAWPDRLYLIDREGRVRYKSPPGPFGFEPAELEKQLRALVP